MRFTRLLLFSAVALALVSQGTFPTVSGQEPAFELPVQLIGFPVIILAVRLSNFVKKLAYSLNPQTYSASSSGTSANSISSRTRRDVHSAPTTSPSGGIYDVEEAERKLVAALGTRVCVMERECVQHALKRRSTEDHEGAKEQGGRVELGPVGGRWRTGRPRGMTMDIGDQPDWEEILSGYKSVADEEKQWYLLSVFIGDIMKSPDLCRKLSKRRPCTDQEMTS